MGQDGVQKPKGQGGPMPQDVKRGYADFADGQIHYRIARPAQPTGKRPLVLFHGSPASSRMFS